MKEEDTGTVAPGSLEARSEVSVPIYKLEKWRGRAQDGIDSDFNERENDPFVKQLDDADRLIGELVMEVEILQKERRGERLLAYAREDEPFAGCTSLSEFAKAP